ncbi:linear amide C-N hydrolase [Kaistia dalseonensis]|uniref:Choloylglycine hydrolase n=1 Tax=Kaistia dalseonensis TaxID=410840 RepID=A0ABU0H1Q8_9HYPH|nr:linear amide C-N hydrolase [Kaistia dalseonensis]MCX5493145.1 linear amide C-N hydrolase [Kaistia dalseonensis]MDQ0435700.1 choloylglycine hydrolase [Kaistia dalseonensis]
MKRIKSALVATVAVLALSATSLLPADACTRAVYIGSDDVVITGRTMDWAEDMRTNLWVFPRGIERDGAAGTNTPKWTSKYGSVIASGYDVGTADGMNEAGLVANLLYLTESDYGGSDGRPTLSISLWAQYALDNYATVAEAVAALEKEPFRVVTATLPNGRAAQLHLAISDATGDSAIFEYIGGKLVIHHGREYRVMTNSPSYDQQLALNAYWEDIGGQTFLPGTIRAADRFARTSYLIQAIPTKAAPEYLPAVPAHTYANQAVASVLSVMRSISVPLGLITPGQPNLAATIWRTVADQKDKVYYFDSSTSPNAFWVPLSDFDLKPGAPVKTLTIAGAKIYAGNVADKFVAAPSFTFMPVPQP